MLQKIYRAERIFVAVACGVMGIMVFLDVVHRVTTRERTVGTTLVITLVAWLVAFMALRTRNSPKSTGAQMLAALGAVLAGGALLKGFVWLMPNGLVWSQTLALVLMLWMAMVGSSMATHEHRHLSLDLGSKLWPKSMLPHVQAVGNVITALFCLTLAGLSVVSLRSHFGDWSDTDGAGGHFAALDVPKWIAFSVMPLSFLVMTVRFLLQAGAAWKGAVEEDDAMHLLGLDQEAPK